MLFRKVALSFSQSFLKLLRTISSELANASLISRPLLLGQRARMEPAHKIQLQVVQGPEACRIRSRKDTILVVIPFCGTLLSIQRWDAAIVTTPSSMVARGTILGALPLTHSAESDPTGGLQHGRLGVLASARQFSSATRAASRSRHSHAIVYPVSTDWEQGIAKQQRWPSSTVI